MSPAAKRAELWRSAYSADRAKSYEELIRESVGPIYDAALGAVAEAVCLLSRRRSPRVLDLGAGTGNTTARMREAMPSAPLVGLDGSAHMLALARKRFAADKLVSFVEGDFGSPDWMKELGTYDAVISTGAIHHLDAAGKRRLFGQVFLVLNDGGVFVCGDPLQGASKNLERMYENAWVRLIQRNLSRSRKNVSLESIRARHRQIQKDEGDIPSPLEDQLGWLRQAGFKQVDCYWKHFGFAVFGGIKE
jgi:tRNA (cmo5U34)-methyltransferase